MVHILEAIPWWNHSRNSQPSRKSKITQNQLTPDENKKITREKGSAKYASFGMHWFLGSEIKNCFAVSANFSKFRVGRREMKDSNEVFCSSCQVRQLWCAAGPTIELQINKNVLNVSSQQLNICVLTCWSETKKFTIRYNYLNCMFASSVIKQVCCEFFRICPTKPRFQKRSQNSFTLDLMRVKIGESLVW